MADLKAGSGGLSINQISRISKKSSNLCDTRARSANMTQAAAQIVFRFQLF